MRRFARDEWLTDNQDGKVDPDYLAEVEAHTERRVREYAAAERRLAHAHRKHEAAKRRADALNLAARERRARSAAVEAAWRLVEERLRELRILEGLMTEVPAGRDHRGSGQAKHRS